MLVPVHKVMPSEDVASVVSRHDEHGSQAFDVMIAHHIIDPLSSNQFSHEIQGHFKPMAFCRPAQYWVSCNDHWVPKHAIPAAPIIMVSQIAEIIPSIEIKVDFDSKVSGNVGVFLDPGTARNGAEVKAGLPKCPD